MEMGLQPWVGVDGFLDRVFQGVEVDALIELIEQGDVIDRRIGVGHHLDEDALLGLGERIGGLRVDGFFRFFGFPKLGKFPYGRMGAEVF